MTLRIHFLNVGHGDCTLIEFPSGRLAMIDISNSTALPEEDKASLKGALSKADLTRLETYGKSWEDYYREKMVDPVDYHREELEGRQVFRYIQTHPDMDHMNGLEQFFGECNQALTAFWDQPNSKEVSREDCESHPAYEYADWERYQMMRRGEGSASGHKVLQVLPGSKNRFWEEDGIEVLAPSETLRADADRGGHWNDLSYVVRVDYAGRSIILPGDAEQTAWEEIMGRIRRSELGCDVLKAPHHGRETGYHAEAVEAMDPSIVICSVGKKPESDASEKYRNKGARVFSTRYQGTMVVTVGREGGIRADSAYSGEHLASL